MSMTRLPDYVVRRPSGFYRSTNPGTKLVVAALEVLAAFLLPGWIGPAVVLAAVLATAAVARRLRGLATFGLAASPIVGSILLVNLFLLPGASDPIARLARWLRPGAGSGSVSRQLPGSWRSPRP